MYSNEDFENFYVRYKAEALPKGVSIQSWCMKNKVSWNLFNKLYRDTRHRIVPVDVEGHPAEEEIKETGRVGKHPTQASVRIRRYVHERA